LTTGPGSARALDNPGPLTHSCRSVTVSGMTRRRQILLFGLVLVAPLLLAVVAGVAALWPTASEAERKAALIRVEMTKEQVQKVLR
jgi:hypothetical protein